MEWTKIKTKHFLFSEMKRTAKADLVSLLCLTAHLEKMPTEQQMLKVTTKSTLNNIQLWLKKESELLESVLAKVLEDVEKVNHKKIISRETTARYRNAHKNSDVSRDVSCDAIEKRREEKIYKNKGTGVFQKPSLSDIEAFISDGSFNVCGATFYDHYESNGWVVGKAKMKDWKATIRNWHRRNNGAVKQERPKV